MACLNKIGVDYVCFGNHETDVPYEALLVAIKQVIMCFALSWYILCLSYLVLYF